MPRRLILAVLFLFLAPAYALCPPGLLGRPLQAQAPAPAVRGGYITDAKKEILLHEFAPRLVKALWFEDYRDLDFGLASGELVEVKDSPALGFVLRKTGKWPIGEREPKLRLRQKFYRLRKSAAGLLFHISWKLKETENPKLFKELEVTSLVRTGTYQRRLSRTNALANVSRVGIPPTHVLGLAFDIARAKMPLRQQRDLLKILEDLAAERRIVFFVEGTTQAAFHVIALPSSSYDFSQVYAEAMRATGHRTANGDGSSF